MNITFRALGILALLVIVMLGSSCRKTDYRTHKIRVPGLKNEKCEEIVRDALVRYSKQPSMDCSVNKDGSTNKDGSINIAELRFDLKGRWVIVEYDSMKVALKNLEHAIAAAGFAANDIPADSNAVANLPPECR